MHALPFAKNFPFRSFVGIYHGVAGVAGLAICLNFFCG
jgi:hypothetical protein